MSVEPADDWPALTDESRSVTGVYGGAPSLQGFALMDFFASGGEVRIQGDLSSLPDPLPRRWQERGYRRAGLNLYLYDVAQCEIQGVPTLHFDDQQCMIGDPVDLSIAPTTRTWTLPDGSEQVGVEVRGESPRLRFRIEARGLSATIEGYKPAPY